MEKEKRCSGCKDSKSLSNFYKNKLTLDGHSNYCVECTRENSKKYFQRKKERQSKIENDNLMKMVLLNGMSTNSDGSNADGLMKVLMIEKMVKSISEELEGLKSLYIRTENEVVV
jgi:hypothetical protein